MSLLNAIAVIQNEKTQKVYISPLLNTKSDLLKFIENAIGKTYYKDSVNKFLKHREKMNQKYEKYKDQKEHPLSMEEEVHYSVLDWRGFIRLSDKSTINGLFLNDNIELFNHDYFATVWSNRPILENYGPTFATQFVFKYGEIPLRQFFLLFESFQEWDKEPNYKVYPFLEDFEPELTQKYELIISCYQEKIDKQNEIYSRNLENLEKSYQDKIENINSIIDSRISENSFTHEDCDYYESEKTKLKDQLVNEKKELTQNHKEQIGFLEHLKVIEAKHPGTALEHVMVQQQKQGYFYDPCVPSGDLTAYNLGFFIVPIVQKTLVLDQ